MTLLSPNFFIGTIRIGTVEGASCVNFGNNAPSGFESFKKHSQGLGSISGDGNHIEGLRSLLNDSAIMDLLTSRDEKDVPDWVKELIQEKMKGED
ncbi:hypothetical protein ACFFHH_14335 [Cytobacillus solani]|uniref:Uncharacterized protein n=1 Tax=Cytobacillus solani TaxID=1637975 RepID=A0A0Q3VIG0_9BACI|nr:hypothetical protein [Cytobacillus solani]KOP71754.1 hypothetical protein AMS60_20860 [Bacillus sp. FJAT-21945]KQL21571.1 hypothetical protein AN957_25445 [Cytobacillus solani]USK54879.1 hypothetical protein LIS82_25620 [Cytobacillus solani]